MRIGVPREIKPGENRVALTPGAVRQLIGDGHSVTVERGAGAGAGYDDASYRAAGAQVEDWAASIWASSELLVKVKEPVEAEYGLLRPDLKLFTYLHLAPNRALTEALIDSGTTAIAYETVQGPDGELPLLAPMSEIAGRLAAHVAAHHLQRVHGGPGILAGGVPGIAPARVLIIGGGVVGTQAARIARRAPGHAQASAPGPSPPPRSRELSAGSVRVLTGDEETLAAELEAADAVIGAVLIPGATAPRVLTGAMLPSLRHRAVLVDVAIDQGGCFETSRPTSHDQPTFVVDDVLHYCVANMPGAVPRTATGALVNATFPYVRRVAAASRESAVLGADDELARGLNVSAGRLCHPAVAAAFPDLPSAAPPTRSSVVGAQTVGNVSPA